MRLQLSGKAYWAPTPKPLPGECFLRVVRSEQLERPASADESRFTFRYPVAKLLYFTLREGPMLALAKVQASRLQRRIQLLRAVVIALCEDGDGQSYLAVGPQDCPDSEWICFNAEFVCRIPLPETFEEYACRVREYFQHDIGAFARLFHFSSFSGVESTFSLIDILRDFVPSGVMRSIPNTSIDPAEGLASRHQGTRNGKRDLFLAGAGAYSYAYILPNLKDLNRHTIIDINPLLSAVMGEKFGFAHRECSTSLALSRLEDCNEPVLVIATYHSTHVDIAGEALSRNRGTKIFIEKPPVTNHEQLRHLIQMRRDGNFIEIGYNRRQAPMVEKAARLVKGKGKGPVTMTCIVKELALPLSHWYYWPSQGTRVTGNLCHWIDLGTFFINALPVQVTVVSNRSALAGDELTVVVIFEDESRLTLMATDCGNPLRGVQEYIDIRRDDLTVVIDDFLTMRCMERDRTRVYHSLIRDKGHARMYRNFSHCLRAGNKPSYSDRDLLVSSLTYLAVAEAALNGEGTITIDIAADRETLCRP